MNAEPPRSVYEKVLTLGECVDLSVTFHFVGHRTKQWRDRRRSSRRDRTSQAPQSASTNPAINVDSTADAAGSAAKADGSACGTDRRQASSSPSAT